MDIEHLKITSSTQKYLIEKIKNDEVANSLVVLTDKQKNGVGSRNNSWIGEDGNLFFSIAIQKKMIPKDIPIQSLSIYFATIMKNILLHEDRNIFIKWPNDFYIFDKKVGGVITSIIRDFVVVGIGINISKSSNFGVLKTELTNIEIVKKYIFHITKYPNWKTVFQSYSLEFYKNANFFVNTDNGKKSLKNVKLNFDGSIILDNQTIFSSR